MNTQVFPIKVSQFFFKNYCYVILHNRTKDAILIDPAWEVDKIEAILNTHQAIPRAVLLTHHHFDHINLAEHFSNRYQIPVLMSKIEIDYYGFSCQQLTPIVGQGEFQLGEIKIQFILTPGHTKGALCYLIEDSLFSGDTLFIEGCGMCIGKGSDPEAMFDSLSYLKRILPLKIKIYPGHSYGQEPGQTWNYLLENNMYLQFHKREEFVAFRMRKDQPRLLAFR